MRTIQLEILDIREQSWLRKERQDFSAGGGWRMAGGGWWVVGGGLKIYMK